MAPTRDCMRLACCPSAVLNVLLAAFAVVLTAGPARAINTWDGGGSDGLWTTAANWDTNLAPDTLTTTATNSLWFQGTSLLSSTNTYASGTLVNLTFGTSGFTLSGSALALTGSITNVGTATQTINLGLVLSSTRTLTGSGGGTVVLAGPLSGGGLTLQRIGSTGTATVTVSGSNSHTGDIRIDANAWLNINNDNALGSGGIALIGNSNFDNLGSTRSFATANLVLAGVSGTFIGSTGLTLGGTTTITGASRTLGVLGTGTLTLGRLAADAATRGLTKTGSGTLRIAGAADGSFQGGFTLSGGTLVLDHNQALGSGTTSLGNGTALTGAVVRTTADFTGVNAITNPWRMTDYAAISGTNSVEFKGSFTNVPTGRYLNNGLSAGSSLIFSGNVYTNGATNTAYTLTLKGTGATLVSGTVSDFPSGLAGGFSLAGYTGTATFSGLIQSGTFTTGDSASTPQIRITNGNFLAPSTVLVLAGGSIQSSADLVLANPVIFNESNTYFTGSSNVTLNGSYTQVTVSRTLKNLLDSGRSLAIQGPVSLPAGGYSGFDGTGNTVISGTISGGGNVLQINGSGTTTLSAANQYTGTTTLGTVGTPVLALGDKAALGQSVLTVTTGTLRASADLSGANAVANTVIFSGGQSLVVDGANDITLSGTLQATAATLVNNLGAGRTLRLTGQGVIAATGTSNRVLTIDGGGSTIISGALVNSSTGAGLGSVTKNGSGSLTLAGNNTYSNITTVSGGTVTISGSNNGAGGVTVAAATLNINSPFALGSGTLTFTSTAGVFDNTSGSKVTLGAGNLLNLDSTAAVTFLGSNDLDMGNSPVYYTSTIGERTIAVLGSTLTLRSIDSINSRAFKKTGAGTLVLTASSTADGHTTIDGGTLRLSGSGQIGSAVGARLYVTSGVFDLNGINQTTGGNGVYVGGGPAGSTAAITTKTGTLTLAASLTYQGSTGNDAGGEISGFVNLGSATRTFSITDSSAAAVDLLVAAGVSGTVGLTKSGQGTLELAGLNTYSGVTTVNTGTGGTNGGPLVLSGTLNGTSGVSIGTGGFLNQTSSGAVGGIGTSLSVAASGTAWLAGSNTYTGTTSIPGGADNARIVLSGTLDGSTINVANATAVFTQTASGAIRGGSAGIIVGTGATVGTLFLSGSNSYGAGTTVNLANLYLGNDSALGTGVVAFSSGTIQAIDRDVTLGNAFSLTTMMVTGTQNLAITGKITGVPTSSRTLTNGIAAGRTLTLGNIDINTHTSAVTLTLAGTGNTTITGTIADGAAVANGLTVTNTGTTTIAGMGNYTGATTLSGAGVLVLSGTIAGSSDVRVSSAAGVLVQTAAGGISGTGGFTLTNGLARLAGVNTYTGTTTVTAGTLKLEGPLALPGGMGATGGTSYLNVTTGVIGLATSGTFERALGTGPSQVRFSSATGPAGFAAYGGDRYVNLGGNGAAMGIGDANFFTAGTGTFALSAPDADGTLYFLNDFSIGAGGGNKYILVYDGSAAVDAVMSGSFSNGSNRLPTKVGPGTLSLTNANSSNQGAWYIQDGVVTVSAFSNSGSRGPLGTAGWTDLGGVATTGTLRYTGSGHVSNWGFNLSSSGGVLEAAGSGPLQLSGAVTGTATGDATFTLTGTSTAANEYSGAIANSASGVTSVAKRGSGSWTLSGASSYTGPAYLQQGTLYVANASALGTGAATLVGGTDAGLGGTARLLVVGTATLSRSLQITAAGSGATQTVVLGGTNTSGTAAFGSAIIAVARDVTLQAATGGVVRFSSNWTGASGSGSLTDRSFTFGSVGSAGTVIVSSSITTTSGSMTVAAGIVRLADQIVRPGAGQRFLVGSAGELAGTGTVAAVLAGAGSVGPGNSPGILLANGVDPTGGLDFDFEFTDLAPLYSSPTASANDILRLTGTAPFTQDLTAANAIDIYFPAVVLTTSTVQTYRGGFFTDSTAAQFAGFQAAISGAAFTYYVSDPSGTISYKGNPYSLLPGTILVTPTTTTVASAGFSGGTVTNGQITTFVVVPEPETAVFAGIGIAMLGWTVWKRRRLAAITRGR